MPPSLRDHGRQLSAGQAAPGEAPVGSCRVSPDAMPPPRRRGPALGDRVHVSVAEIVPTTGLAAVPATKPVRTVVALGDSTPVGLGDPLPGGGWRGFCPLLAEALNAKLVNLADNGARIAGVRRTQLPAALAACTRPSWGTGCWHAVSPS